MRLGVAGAGIQAKAAIFDLLRQDDVKEVVVFDASAVALRKMEKFFAQRVPAGKVLKVKPHSFGQNGKAVEALSGCRAILSALPYRYNELIAHAALKAGCHFCDLGGNNDVTEKVLELDDWATEVGLSVIPDCGLAPGLVSVLTAHAVRKMDSVANVFIRVGGLPQNNRLNPPINYSLSFSPEGLINEYAEPCLVLKDGKLVKVPPLTGIEGIHFSETPGTDYVAFHTSGGASTLPKTMRGAVQNLDYKTIRYPGHAFIFNGLRKLGMFSEAGEGGAFSMAPRDMLIRCMKNVLDLNAPDMILLRVLAQGMLDGEHYIANFTAVEYPDETNDLTAMQRCTAFPATTVMLMQARGQVLPGAKPQEVCINTDVFLKEIRRKGIKIASNLV